MATLTWLGQAGFALRAGDGLTLIDPWLTDHEDRTRPPLDAQHYVEGVDTILVTHEHEDHFDRGFVAAVANASPDVRVVVAREIADEAGRLVGGERIVPVDPGDRLVLGAVVVHAVRADHMFTGGTPLPGCLGYVIEVADGPTLYHSGDTLVTDELVAALEAHSVDIALLPVNGRDYYREKRDLVGNPTSREAVEFALGMGAGILIPMHWDADRGNTERPGTVPDYVVDIEAPLHTVVLARGVPWPLVGA